MFTGTSPSSIELPFGWNVIHTAERPSVPASYKTVDDLALHPAVRGMLQIEYPLGIYHHQHAAIAAMMDDANVCITTGTASGKTLPFHVTALQRLIADPAARVVAVYPQRSLAAEQTERWTRALAKAGIDGGVARIDGSVPVAERKRLLSEARVLVMTPDVLHTWLLGQLSEAVNRRFLKALRLVVVDEVHTYTGVFGSNSAFLFRRLRHAVSALGGEAKFLCASATIGDPLRHLANLFGLDFRIIGAEQDTSPKHPVRISMLEPSPELDGIQALADLVRAYVEQTSCRFIVFVDSRREVEMLTTVLRRGVERGEVPLESDAGDTGSDEEPGGEFIPGVGVLSYRAGYNEEDRSRIQKQLSDGSIRGVISTSALELGLDIDGLDLAILVGVPQSATSFNQRIGRIGRSSPGQVVITNSRSAMDVALFKEPSRILHRPLAESTLYLENERIQYIHALCLMRSGAEYESAGGQLERPFESRVDWPAGFVERCEAERTGQTSSALMMMAQNAGDSPQHAYPLRDVERQYDIEMRHGPEALRLGSIGYAQLMREAYPGAIYLHMARPYRVVGVSHSSRKVHVVRTRHYATKPIQLPTSLFPNLSPGNVFHAERRGQLVLLDCAIQVRESIVGFQEKRGPITEETRYPIYANLHKSRVDWKQSRFTRNYHTTGIVLSLPVLGEDEVNTGRLALLLLEAFMLIIPLERQDIGVSDDAFLGGNPALPQGARFIAVFDRTYGSLRLSSRLRDVGVFERVVEEFLQLVRNDEACQQSDATIQAAQVLAACCMERAEPVAFGLDPAPPGPSQAIRVIAPDSPAWDTSRGNTECTVKGVFYAPRLNGVAYQVVRSEGGNEQAKETIPLHVLQGIAGVTRYALYDPDTNELELE